MGNATAPSGWSCAAEALTEDCRYQAGCGVDDLLDRKYLNVQLIAGARDGEVDVVRDALRGGAHTETRQPMRILAGITTGLPAPVKARVQGPTPLMLAAKSGSVQCIELLLAARAKIHAKDEDGLRPLHFAALSGELCALKVLLAARACPGERDNDQLTVLDHLPAEVRRDVGEFRQWEQLLGAAVNVIRPSGRAMRHSSPALAEPFEDGEEEDSEDTSECGLQSNLAGFMGERLRAMDPP